MVIPSFTSLRIKKDLSFIYTLKHKILTMLLVWTGAISNILNEAGQLSMCIPSTKYLRNRILLLFWVKFGSRSQSEIV